MSEIFPLAIRQNTPAKSQQRQLRADHKKYHSASSQKHHQYNHWVYFDGAEIKIEKIIKHERKLKNIFRHDVDRSTGIFINTKV